MAAKAPLVFLSCVKEDNPWKERLEAQLRVLEKLGMVSVWTDDQLVPSRPWFEQLEEALATARVAILLISAHYLTSNFVQERELPSLVKRWQRGEVSVIPVLVSASLWETVPWIRSLQMRPSDGRPLESLSVAEANAALVAIAREIRDLVARDAGLARSSGALAASHLRLQDIRGFRNFEMNLRSSEAPPRSKTLLIGRNGTGKTTLLRALALSLCDPVDAGALIAEPNGNLVAEGKRGEIEVGLTARTGDEVSFTLRQEILNAGGKDSILNLDSERPSGMFVCAYGAGRYGIGTDTGRDYRIRDSVASLFDYRQTLVDSELTLRRLQDFLGTSRFDATMRGIKRVLGLTQEDEIHLPRGGGVEVSGPTVGRRVRLEGWADGYRLTLAWLLDLYGWAMRADRVQENGGIDGILLIDEIEQHLHPSMQTRILPRLAEILPGLQIIATTHSPLVALSVAPGELVSLRRQGGTTIAEPSIPDFSDYSAEDMLVDEHLFDTEAYGPETSRKLERYRRLAIIPPSRRSAEESEELAGLAGELLQQQIPEVRESDAVRELRSLIAKHGL